MKIEAGRDAYAPHQIGKDSTMTVGELIDELNGWDSDLPVFFSHDNGYTYGGVSYDIFEEAEDDEWEEDESNE